MVKKLKSWLNIVFLTVILIVPGLVFATSIKNAEDNGGAIDRLNKTATTYGPFSKVADETTLATTLGLVIGIALSILGIIFLVITIISGFKWMTAEGNESKVEQARGTITRAVIGLIVVISSYAIWIFIRNNFIEKI